MKSVIKSLEYMTIAASYHDVNGNVIYVNPVFCKLFKTNQKTIVDNKLSSDLIGVDIISTFNIFEFINNNMNNIDNFIIKIKDNNDLKIIKISSLVIKNGLDFHILLYDDVTNSMSQSYIYEELFNNIKMGIIILRTKDGEEFYIKDVNPYAETMNLINKDKVVNTKFSELEYVNDIVIDMVKNVWRTGIKIEKHNIECINKNLDKPCWRSVYVYKIHTSDIIILFEDTSEIIETKRKFEQYDKQKTTFLSNMSHEIRTPINAIVGFADLLKNANDKNTRNEYIDIIKNSSKVLSQLVDDILDMTKIEAGKLKVSKNNFDINEIVEELFITLKTNAPKNIEVKKNLPYRSIKLNNDEFRFRQIFNNLISNAIKFTKEGSIEIGYKKDEDYVIFYVKDTGIGIQEEDKDKVFKRFEQVKESSKIGHGLGLCIANELVKLMEGELWFESEYGEGSTFYFKLPNDRKLGRRKDTKYIDYDMSELDLKDKTILIVEDIDFNTKLLISYLEHTYANIITAVDGNEALIKYNENKNDIDLILMDIQIPNIDGKEVTQIIRTIDSKIVIIAQTAYAMKEEIDDIMDSGFDDLIKKPIKKDDLLRVINKHIGGFWY